MEREKFHTQIIIQLTLQFAEMTATGLLEFKRGRKYWIISSNCKIKLEIRIRDRSPPAFTTTAPTSTTSPSTLQTTAESTKSTTNQPNDSQFVDETTKLDDSSDVETSDVTDWKWSDFPPGIIVTLLFIAFLFSIKFLYTCIRKRFRQFEIQGRRFSGGDSLATDLSFQPVEIFA